MRILVIVNHVAAKARQSWPTIKTRLNAAGIEYQSQLTESRGDATIKTRAALAAGADLIVVVGGDGTLSEAAEGFFYFGPTPEVLPTPINPNATLAILPAGTGDDFARGLRAARAPLSSWIETLVTHVRGGAAARSIDVLYGVCDDFQKPFICLNASTMGIGGETAGRVAAQGNFMRSFSGEFRFVFAAVGALAAWRERRVRVSVDGRVVLDGPMNLVGVANGLYAGGGMMLSPAARPDDGKLDVITASGLNRANIVTELSRIHRGGHLKNPKVSVTQGSIVKIETLLLQDAMPLEADGNVRGVTPVQFTLIPSAIKFLS